jgi:hypothetical protein
MVSIRGDRLRAMKPLARMLVPLLLLAAGCALQAQENFYAVRPGMTSAEVEDLLGKPSSTWPTEDGGTRLQWGDNLSSLATDAVFADAEPEHVWIVWLDDRGQVIRKREADYARRR